MKLTRATGHKGHGTMTSQQDCFPERCKVYVQRDVKLQEFIGRG